LTRTLPKTLTAGLSFKQVFNLAAYPAPDWVLALYLRGPAVIDLACNPIGLAHEVTVQAVESTKWESGRYWYSLRASKDYEVIEIETGEIQVLPNLQAQTEGFDGRTHQERVLEAIEAVLERRSTLDQDRYRINNRELYRTPIPDLLKLRDRYKAEISRMNAAKSGRLFDQVVRVRFR